MNNGNRNEHSKSTDEPKESCTGCKKERVFSETVILLMIISMLVLAIAWNRHRVDGVLVVVGPLLSLGGPVLVQALSLLNIICNGSWARALWIAQGIWLCLFGGVVSVALLMGRMHQEFVVGEAVIIPLMIGLGMVALGIRSFVIAIAGKGATRENKGT